MAAHERHAASDFRAAAAAYAQALRAAPDDWPRRSEALYGRLQALGQSGQYDECARFGIEHAERVSGAVTPSDFARTLQRCSDNVASPELRRAARRAALTRLRRIVEAPPPEMSVDDRADALEGYAEALIAEGDRNSARTVEQQRLRLMEEAAESATSPQMAQTYDYGRARAYVALGRAGEAVRLLEGRMRQLPDSYEPPARLASVLAQIGRHKEALTAVERALQLSYGPRKLQYLALKARILEALGDRAAAIAALEQEVQGYEALPPGHANPRRVDDARKRLAAARRAKPR
jgi:tetratricopeptide (TPR) repeat protein